MVEKIRGKAHDKVEETLKNFIVTAVKVAQSAAPEVPRNAVNIEASVEIPGMTLIPKIHLSVKVDLSKV
jgi:hypothetical protein